MLRDCGMPWVHYIFDMQQRKNEVKNISALVEMENNLSSLTIPLKKDSQRLYHVNGPQHEERSLCCAYTEDNILHSKQI